MRSSLLIAAFLMSTSASSGLAAQDQAGARIYGLVLDQDTGKPVSDVDVSIAPGDLHATTGNSGHFVLRDIPFGRHVIRFTRLGYTTRADTFQAGPGLPLDITVRLATSPVPLDPIEVAVRSGALASAGFYDRRDLGPHGTFFTEVDIEKLVPMILSDLLYRAPSVIVMRGGPGRTLVRFNRQVGMGGRLPGCEPAVFLDGALTQDQSGEPRLLDFNRVPPSVVAGIEVYVGVNTPIEYKRNPCGSILIWTKRGS